MDRDPVVAWGRVLVRCLVMAVLTTMTPAALAQVEGDLADRPISEIQIEGLERVSEQLVRNQLRTAVGDPYDPAVVSADVRRLTRLGDFRFVDVVAKLRPDGTVLITYQVDEQKMITAVQVVGNKLLNDQELLAVVRLAPGLPRDDFLIEKAERDMEALYRKNGHYLATVEVDRTELDERGILLFRIIEGPRVKIQAVGFEGNNAFPSKQLAAEVKTKKALPLVRAGVLDEDVLARDEASLDTFYKDRGYLDVRVGRRIDLSPDNREAKVTFIIDEGRQYTLRTVRAIDDFTGGDLRVFAPEQIAAIIDIKPGDVYSQDRLRKSRKLLRDAYGYLGYLDVQVRVFNLRNSDRPEVDLLLRIDEGEQSKVGLVRIGGNFLTRDRVIRRLVRFKPGRPIDATEITKTQERLERTRLFNDVRITLQDPDPDNPEYRDVLVEIKERNTGSVNFGLAVGSDSGLFGDFSINQSNFDIADFPESFDELVKGAAFRGGGQRFNMTLRPGNELFQYTVSLTEPHLFETDNSGTVFFSFRERIFEDYTEDRITGQLGVGRRLGDIWEIGGRFRMERVKLFDIDDDAPAEVFRDAGPNNINTLGFTLTRTTVPSIVRPGRGSRTSITYDYSGLGGDFDFHTAEVEYTVFLTLDEDFLGRKTTLKFNTRTGIIFGGEAPIYEKFYLGGRSFRGFEFRTISPKGTQLDGSPSEDPVGGDWLFFFGTQYEFPLFGNAIAGALFVDSGTVQEDFGFDQYRLSVGFGVRIVVPQLGPVPLAFDFAIPVFKEKNDQTQTFSFSAELPF